MSESQGYKLGMKMGLSDKRDLFDAVRERGSKREVELLKGSSSASTAFRRGLKSAARQIRSGGSVRKNPREVITYFIKPRRFTSPEAAADKLEAMLQRMNYIDQLDIEEIEDGLYALTIVGPRSFFTADGELIAGFEPEKKEMERLIAHHIGPIQRET